jgi:hypothetical protein
MAISEAQLTTWEAQGATGQFTASYQSIRTTLLNGNAPYPVGDCDVFLQGSYGNDTNVYGDSDVDVVLKNSSTFYRDLTALSAEDLAAYNQAFGTGANYPYANFRAHALAWVQQNFNGTTVGRKAIWVPASGNRREADIVIAQDFRRYKTFKSMQQQTYVEGISLFAGTTLIENFPKQHSANCTAKHQGTNGWFKPTVRVFKNMRNAMIRNSYLAEGVAPSYFLEGMLYNVPNDKFGGNHVDTWIRCFNWIVKAQADQLVCANHLHWLVRDNTPTSWPIANFNAFTSAAKRFWEA